jgi:hypothetical protein
MGETVVATWSRLAPFFDLHDDAEKPTLVVRLDVLPAD